MSWIFLRNQKIYLHYPQLLDTEKVQLIEILPHGSQYHGCWWFGDSRSQDISSHCIDLVFSALSSNWLDKFLHSKSKSLFNIPALAPEGSIYWGQDKMATSLRTTFSNAFSWKELLNNNQNFRDRLDFQLWVWTIQCYSPGNTKCNALRAIPVNMLAATSPYTDHVKRIPT